MASVSPLTASENCCSKSICFHCFCFSSSLAWAAANALFSCCNILLISRCSSSLSLSCCANCVFRSWSFSVFFTDMESSCSCFLNWCSFAAIHSRSLGKSSLFLCAANAFCDSALSPQIRSACSQIACFCCFKRSIKLPAVALRCAVFFSASVSCAFFRSTSLFSGAVSGIGASFGWCVAPQTGHCVPSSRVRASIPACASRKRCSVSLQSAQIWSFSADALTYSFCAAYNCASNSSITQISSTSFLQSCLCSANSFCACLHCKLRVSASFTSSHSLRKSSCCLWCASACSCAFWYASSCFAASSCCKCRLSRCVWNVLSCSCAVSVLCFHWSSNSPAFFNRSSSVLRCFSSSQSAAFCPSSSLMVSAIRCNWCQ